MIRPGLRLLTAAVAVLLVVFLAPELVVVLRSEASQLRMLPGECSEGNRPQGTLVQLDLISRHLDQRVWPKGFSVHREIAEVVNGLPCRQSLLHQNPRDALHAKVLYILNC
eukprot:RCo009445